MKMVIELLEFVEKKYGVTVIGIDEDGLFVVLVELTKNADVKDEIESKLEDFENAGVVWYT